jgi:tetratricopeptide (TPR) repeat protein
MGTVYEAEQDSPRRTVALKVIRPGLATDEHLRRFELESLVLGRLQHPGIAQVFEAGTARTRAGMQPFFAMELVRGLPLLAHAQEYGLGIRQRLELIILVCDAMHHAHLRGVIHRDLKPGNILVTAPESNNVGQPKILDFGVARLVGPDVQMTVHQTSTGQIVGTLPYMSPEQVSGDPDSLDVRSDVYALGVLLYELLSGQLPLDLSKRQIPEAVRMIQEEDPSRLSQHDQRLRGDIEVIVGKALEKEKGRRYQSAEELSDDLRRFLDHRPIEARPPSSAYQLRKFARRNRPLVTGVAAAFLILIAGTAVSTWQAIRATRAEHEAAESAASAQRVSEFLAATLGDIDPERFGNTLLDDLQARLVAGLEARGLTPEAVEDAETAFEESMAGLNRTDFAREVLDKEILGRAGESIAAELERDPLVAARLHHTLGDTYNELGLYDQAQDSYQIAIEIRIAELGEDHQQTLASRHGQATAMNVSRTDATREEDAELFSELYEARRRTLGLEHADTLESLLWVAKLERYASQYLVADSLISYVLDKRTLTLGRDHPATMEAALELSNVCQQLDRWVEAGSLRVYCYETAKATLGPEDPRTLRYGLSLGGHYDNMDKYAEAAALAEELTEIRERVQGRDHALTILQKWWVLHVYEDHLGRGDEAMPIYEEIIRARRRLGGPADIDAAVNSLQLASLKYEWNQTDVADSVVAATFELVLEESGASDPGVLQLRRQWAQTMSYRGEKEEAARLFEELVSLQEAALGESHIAISQTLEWLARILRDLKRCEEAGAAALRSIEIARMHDPDSYAYRNRMLWAGIVFNECDNHETAESLVRHSLELTLEHEGKESRNTAWTSGVLAGVLASQDRHEEARPYFEDYAEFYRRQGALRPRDKAWLCNEMLGDSFDSFVDPQELLDLALAANQSTNYEDPSDLALLAKVYVRAGRLEDAVETQRKSVARTPEPTRTHAAREETLGEYEAELAAGAGSER